MRGTTRTIEKEGMVEIEQDTSYLDYHPSWFAQDPIRRMFQKMGIEDQETYTFLMTVANPDALNRIDQYNKERKKDASSPPRFDMRLLDLYLNALTSTSESHLGKTPKQYFFYPLVDSRQVHSLEQHADQPTWPIVHVIKGTQNIKLILDLVDNIHDDKTYQHIQEQETPFHYRKEEIDLLRSEGINPLQWYDWSAQHNGSTLKDALTLFCRPRNYIEKKY